MPHIERAAMDGNHSSRTVLIDTNIKDPYGLTIDYETNRLYWTDDILHYIHSCDLDGSNRHNLVENTPGFPWGITVGENTLFWTDWYTRSIQSCNKLTGGNMTVVRKLHFNPYDVKVFSQQRQKPGTYLLNAISKTATL